MPDTNHPWHNFAIFKDYEFGVAGDLVTYIVIESA